VTNPIAIRYNGQQKSTSDRPQMTIEIDYNYFWEGLSQEAKQEIAFRCAYDQAIMMHIVNEICSYQIPTSSVAKIKNNVFKDCEPSGGCGYFVNELRQAIAPLAGELTALEIKRLQKENEELVEYKKLLTDLMWAEYHYSTNTANYNDVSQKCREKVGTASAWKSRTG
jgi:hypothetical protein